MIRPAPMQLQTLSAIVVNQKCAKVDQVGKQPHVEYVMLHPDLEVTG